MDLFESDLNLTLPDHNNLCVTSIMPGLIGGWANNVISEDAIGAKAAVVLVIDGLGWNQLQRYAAAAPFLAGGNGQAITTVAPSTTAAGLTSITTGVAPGEHGIIGYRVRTPEGLLNCLRWSAGGFDALTEIPPAEFQPVEPFLNSSPTVVTRAEFKNTGFTEAHLRNAKLAGWWTPFTMITQVKNAIKLGEKLVYAYYDGLDKISHVHGMNEHYLDELAFVDQLVQRLVDELPTDITLVVTADHGLVEVGRSVIEIDRDILRLCTSTSGEARFTWLHARRQEAKALLAESTRYEDNAWVVDVEKVLDEGWFGPKLTPEARNRLGDVALVAREAVAYIDPSLPDGPEMLGRHGSLTAEEMLVPIIEFNC